MSGDIHIAITRIVLRERREEFERLLGAFVSRSLAEPGARGVHCIFPPPGSASREYGILRSFASEAERDAFYQSPLYQEWLRQIAPLTEGEAARREMHGLEAWFRSPRNPMPPRWKMALLTWIAVWPIGELAPRLLLPLLGDRVPPALASGVIAAAIVCVLTWAAMPALVHVARGWLNPGPSASDSAHPSTLEPSSP